MNQNEQILAWLKQGKSITPIEALEEFGCFRLGARIADLKRDGWQIKSRMVNKNGKRFASYILTDEYDTHDRALIDQALTRTWGEIDELEMQAHSTECRLELANIRRRQFFREGN